MDKDATKRVMRRLAEVLPAWLQWRQDVLTAQARFAGDSGTTAAARTMLDLWHLNLADVGEDEALRVVERFGRGSLVPPPYGELPVFVRRESLAARPQAEERRRELHFAEEPRFRCPHCRDSGGAHALDPKFVRDLRAKFLSMTEDDFASTEGGTWWYRARQWHRATYGWRKVEYAVACSCPAGDRRAERQQRLDTQRMPVLHGTLDLRKVLADWYATHDASEVEFWLVPDFAEAE